MHPRYPRSLLLSRGTFSARNCHSRIHTSRVVSSPKPPLGSPRSRKKSTVSSSYATAATANISDPSHAQENFSLSRTPSEVTPTSRYEQLVSRGILREDEHQHSTISRLQSLHDQLRSYNPPEILPPSDTRSFFGRFLGQEPASSLKPPESKVPRGLYLYGDVGTGKSMLMDMFYDTLPSNIRRKRRVHFHAFMIDVHKRVHALKSQHGISDPILPLARDLANEAIVLCLDEFQVTDIVDAMILRRLLECLLQNGVVCVMTSNRHPSDLYKNGIQRSSFIPAIDLLNQRFDVVDLDSGTDYRRVPRALTKVYYHPIDHANRSELNKIFSAFTSSSQIVHNRKLPIWGRTLTIPESSKDSSVAKFTFNELCGNPLSAADYLEITKTFPTVFVTDVPSMNMNHKDKARRFITFIDACYESKTRLFTLSEVPIYQVFSDDGQNSGDLSDHMRSIMDDMGLEANAVGTSSMFTGEDEIFAFARACSRLVQMGTKEWAESSRE